MFENARVDCILILHVREPRRHLREAAVKQCLMGAATLNPLAVHALIWLRLHPLHVVVVQLFCNVSLLGDLACSPLGLVGQHHSVCEKLVRIVRLI